MYDNMNCGVRVMGLMFDRLDKLQCIVGECESVWKANERPNMYGAISASIHPTNLPAMPFPILP